MNNLIVIYKPVLIEIYHLKTRPSYFS